MAREPQKVTPEGVNVTYVPRDGDPAETLWNRIRFRANVPVQVRDPAMVALARGNPWFAVEGSPKAESKKPDGPKTAEEYRAHAVAWFAKAQTAAELDGRWQAEEALREECGVGADDIEWLDTLYQPRMSELKKADQA